MKRLAFFLMLAIATVAFNGCNDPDGKWGPMKWSGIPSAMKDGQLTVPAEGGSFVFSSTNYGSFWIAGIQINDAYIDLSSNYLVEGDWFTVKVVGNQLLIDISRNDTGRPRSLTVIPQAGDAFGQFGFIQEAAE